MTDDTAAPSRPPDRNSTDVPRAWAGVLLIPAGILATVLLGTAVTRLFGYTYETGFPFAVMVLVGVPVTLIGMVPAMAAAYFGQRAWRANQGCAATAAMTIGQVVLMLWGLSFAMSLLVKLRTSH